MILINNILKERLTNKLNFKERYGLSEHFWSSHKIIYNLDNINYCLYYNGDIFYYKNGKQHRDGDLPAVIYSNGDIFYYKNGKQHRDGDLPAVIHNNGNIYYYKNGKCYYINI